MPHPRPLSIEAYPPGSELFVWDAKEVRHVRVTEIIVVSDPLPLKGEGLAG